MFRTRTVPAAALALAFAMSTIGLASAHDPRTMGSGPMGPGMMGQGTMGPGMMGQGMMGQGAMGPGMMEQGPGGCPGYGMMPGMSRGGMMGGGMGPQVPWMLPEDLSVANVSHMMQHQLAWLGNPNLKLGKVEQKDDDTIVAEVVTKEGSLVQRFQIDRHTGRFTPAP